MWLRGTSVKWLKSSGTGKGKIATSHSSLSVYLLSVREVANLPGSVVIDGVVVAEAVSIKDDIKLRLSYTYSFHAVLQVIDYMGKLDREDTLRSYVKESRNAR
jgi:hypothetical protein